MCLLAVFPQPLAVIPGKDDGARRPVAGGSVIATDLRYGFTEDPNLSIFNARAPLTAGGALGPVQAGRDAADATGERLALLFQETYAPACRVVGVDAPGTREIDTAPSAGTP